METRKAAVVGHHSTAINISLPVILVQNDTPIGLTYAVKVKLGSVIPSGKKIRERMVTLCVKSHRKVRDPEVDLSNDPGSIQDHLVSRKKIQNTVLPNTHDECYSCA